MKTTLSHTLTPTSISSETEKLWIRIRDNLEYDPYTGEWFWKKDIRWPKRRKAGTFNRANSRWYIKFEQIQYNAARLAWFYMTGRWPTEIDHIDRNPSNDKWLNLREVTHKENFANTNLRNNKNTGRFETNENH